MADILIAEDEKNIADILRTVLEENAHRVRVVKNGAAALEAYGKKRPDLLILDVMMPKRSGFDVCQEVRKKDKHTPILFLTARNAEIDKVHGFNLGGDDYLTKPFGIHEFIARVSALLRRTLDEIKQAEEEVFEMAGYSVNRSLLTIKDIKTGEEKHLSPREYEMLLLFAANPLVVFSREKIIETIWDCRFGETTRTVDVFISKVRRLLGSRDGCIETVRAGGYRYNPSFGA